MFVQVMQGKVSNYSGLRAQWARWGHALAPEAKGFLGATAGVTDDGEFIAMVRFASESTARRNSERVEQDEWWQTTAGCVEGLQCTDSWRTDVWNRGGSDRAGFVQIRQGTSSDPERLRDLYVNQQPVRMGPLRPEVLGGVFAWDDYGGFTLSAYFTSEAAARTGESLAAFASFFEDIDAVMQDVTYLDLHQPWFVPGVTRERCQPSAIAGPTASLDTRVADLAGAARR
jgi:hypothetical protein